MIKSIRKTVIACIFIVSMITPGYQSAYAAQGTEGNELQVLQPSNMEIQLGPNWTGVEFVLRTDAGIYPGTIVVDDTGTLKLEIGGSKTYILSCLQSDIAVPKPTLTQASATHEKTSNDIPIEKTPAKGKNFPRWPSIVFGVGIAGAAATLYFIYRHEQQRKEETSDEDEQDED